MINLRLDTLNASTEGFKDWFSKNKQTTIFSLLEILNSNKLPNTIKYRNNTSVISYADLSTLLILVNKANALLSQIYNNHSNFQYKIINALEGTSKVPTDGSTYVAQLSKVLSLLSKCVTTVSGKNYPIVTNYNLKNQHTDSISEEFSNKANLLKLIPGLTSLASIIEFSKNDTDNWAKNKVHTNNFSENDADIGTWYSGLPSEVSTVITSIMRATPPPYNFNKSADYAKVLDEQISSSDNKYKVTTEAVLSYCRGYVIYAQCWGICKSIYNAILPTLEKIKTGLTATGSEEVLSINKKDSEMINLNVSSKKQIVKVSLEDITSLFSEINNHIILVNNLVTIKASLKKYGKTPQLTELVGASLESAGITFSVEGIGATLKKALDWLLEKLTKLWNLVISLFTKKKSEYQIAMSNLEKAFNKAKKEGKENIEITIQAVRLNITQRVSSTIKGIVELATWPKAGEDASALMSELKETNILIEKTNTIISFYNDNKQLTLLNNSEKFKRLIASSKNAIQALLTNKTEDSTDFVDSTVSEYNTVIKLLEEAISIEDMTNTKIVTSINNVTKAIEKELNNK